MDCPACGAATVTADVPNPVRAHVPENAERIAICTTCLSLTQTTEPIPDAPAFERISNAFPADQDSAVAVAVLVNLLDSLVLNRDAIQSLVDDLEASGTDVFLVIDRLVADPSLDPAVDLERRRPQVQQFVE